MRLNWNLLRLAMLLAPLFFCGGCGGVNTGATVSPASFFLPGLLKNDAPCRTNAPAAFPAPSKEFASAK